MDREEIMRGVLCGDLSLSDPEVQAACADPELESELLDALATASELDEDSILEEVRGQESGPSESKLVDLATSVLASAPAQERPAQEQPVQVQPASRRLAPWLTLGALAAAALAVFFLRPRPGEFEAPPIYLGTPELTCLSPVGEGADFSTFRWSHDAEAGFYEVEVFDTEGELVERGTSPRLEDAREWQVDPEVHAQWPSAIEWRLRWVSPGGHGGETAFGAATR